jgi:ABC-type Fe3+/spermidine/putrescine transport system ATPase subunit
MASIELKNISKRFAGSTAAAVDTVSMRIGRGEFLTLLGPSGCGKSTTLRIVAGLTQPDTGDVCLDDRVVTGLSPAQRKIGMVFQSLALFPHMTAAENVGFGLRMRNVRAPERKVRIQRALDLVHLAEYADRYPRQLSGGQQQRVAIARALVIEPAVLILDEPFAALDRKLREALQKELHRLTRELEITTLFVTHDQEEALTLSDWIAVMKDGKVEQFGRAGEIFEQPRTRFVADFMGVSNFLAATVVATNADRVALAGEGLQFDGPPFEGCAVGKAVNLAIRPDRVSLMAAGANGEGNCGTVSSALYQGITSTYTVALASGRSLVVRDINTGTGFSRFKRGETVSAHIAREAVCVLPQ